MNPKAMVAEFIGAFTLLFVGVGAIAANQLGAGTGPLGVALAHGLAIAVMVAAVGSVSGGHFNPAISLGMMVAKKIPIITMIGYWIVQVLGAVAGVWVLTQCVDINGLKQVAMGLPAVGDVTTQLSAIIMELVLTFFLVLVVYGASVDKRSNKAAAGLFIGLTITMGALVAGEVSGAAMNPARFLGSAFFAKGGMENLVVYLTGPLLGGLVAGVVIWVLDEKEPVEAVE